ncbi:MAG: hypothetical protein KDB27_24760, partial [Planctomycetales bacterium]|nr:hypothetical protein [Planctomycetales bacterium]
MQTNIVFLICFSIAATAASVVAQDLDVDRVYFVPARFVRLVSDTEGIVASKEAFARAGEVRNGQVAREWTIRIPNGHSLRIQDTIKEGGATWHLIEPESLIAARFNRHSQNQLATERRFGRRASVNSVRAAQLTRNDNWSSQRTEAAAGSGVALAQYAEPSLSIPSFSEMPTPEVPMEPSQMGFPHEVMSAPGASAATVPDFMHMPTGPNGISAGYPTGNYYPPSPANCATNRGPNLGARRPSIAIPPMIGGFFDSSNLNVQLTTQHSFDVFGQTTNGGLMLFERDGAGVFNDLVSIPGTGADASGDGIDDTFQISEPLPPNDVPTAPSATATYAGGTATYTGGNGTTAIDGQFGNNSIWRAEYGFNESLQMVAPGGVRRITVSDNNSPVPRDRIHFDYRSYHNATAGFGNVNRYTFGV